MERKHQPLTREEAIRLGLLEQRGANTPEAKALRARYDAERKFVALQQAEQGMAHATPLEAVGVDLRGAAYLEHQLAADAQRLGYARATESGRSYRAPADPAVVEAGGRMNALRENTEAAAALERARSAYDDAATAAANLAGGLVEANHREAVSAKQTELQRAMQAWHETPANGELADQVKRLQAEVEQLVKNPPK